MKATRPAVWAILQGQMRRDEPYSLRELYDLVQTSMRLDKEDLASDGVSQSRWERNVRNLLQYRLGTGHVHRTDRGEYVLGATLQTAASVRTPAPWSLRAPRFLHGRLLDALSPFLISQPDAAALDQKPLILRLGHPLPALCRFYLYLATDHPSERSLGDYRIQVILPGHREGGRARFDRSEGAVPFLVGYVPSFDVFVLWDADLHDSGRGIPYSKGVQVHASTVYGAVAAGSALQTRRVREGGGRSAEVVVATRATRLPAALEERRSLTIRSVLEAS